MGSSGPASTLTPAQMWLNLTEDECRGVGAFANKTAPPPLPDDPLVEVAPLPAQESMDTQAPSAQPSLLPKPEPSGPLFQSLADDESDSSSESDDEPNLNKFNESWATLMMELEALRATAGTMKAKGKKSKGQGVVLETPEMVKLKSKISRLEKEYMFSKKDAGTWGGHGLL